MDAKQEVERAQAESEDTWDEPCPNIPRGAAGTLGGAVGAPAD